VTDFEAKISYSERLFVMQSERPSDLRDLEIGDLDPFLRSLLFTNGIVTRAVEARTRRRVTVHVVDQRHIPIPVGPATCLTIPAGERTIRRRVVMTTGELAQAPALFGYAESYIVSEMLPHDFLAVLSLSRGGIGEALVETQVKNSRELLWFGLGKAPRWIPLVDKCDFVVRAYRIVTGDTPAISILEGLRAQIRGKRIA
jgi:chorismate-pyruvate lyase